VNRRRRVRVPASSANLGPGYDVFAAALSLSLTLEVEETGELTVESDTPGVPLDRSNLCVRAFERLHPADGLSFRIRSQIPPSGGLGSSAAAIVAGLVAADHLYELDAPVLEHAIELEGHPDNVSAAYLGGFVLCAEDGPLRIEPPAGLEGVIVTPPTPVPTAEARAALPREVPMSDAVYNIASASLLAVGLAQGDLGVLARGLTDSLHQERRAHLYPRSLEMIDIAKEKGALGATISGAGPSVLVWCHWEQTGGVVDALDREAPECVVQRVQFNPSGADVEDIR
jgi:homoserine kinase